MPSIKCATQSCKFKNRYKSSTSKTAVKKKGTFDIRYGDGSNVFGNVWTDTGMMCRIHSQCLLMRWAVQVGGIVAKNQVFSPVSESEQSGDSEFDGLVVKLRVACIPYLL